MSRTTLRIVIVLAALSIAGITFTQFYWVKRAFALRENQFYRDVNSALYNVAAKIFEINKTTSPAVNPVNQLSTNYFVVSLNSPVDASLLEFLLSSEFEKRNISAEYEFGIYDCMEKCMSGGSYRSPQKIKAKTAPQPFPEWNVDGYYFGVLFPSVEANLISQMGIWGFSSAVMLVVIFFFVYTLFVILKQRRLSEIQKDFINNMTHEFKTPISTIAISSEVLKDPSIIHAPERLLNYATIIQNENQRLKQQVERVLQMARIEKADIGLKKERIDVHELINEAVRNIALALNEKGGHVELALSAGTCYSMVDRLHFTNVMHNLLDNAIKYNLRPPQITIRTYVENGNIFIEVEDNGIGISADAQRKIFQKFYRVPTGNLHNVKGFGLGLNYVKLIVEGHRGRVSVKSEPEKGSVFIVSLPVA